MICATWTKWVVLNKDFLFTDIMLLITLKFCVVISYINIVTFVIADSMEQSPPWEANSLSASEKNCRPIMETKSPLSYSQQPPLVSILTQINPVHTFLPYLLNIHFNIIFLSIPWSSELSLQTFRQKFVQ
jgi:hypothetical protein